MTAPVSGFADDRPFAAFLGEWAGTGDIVGSDGTHERIRCKATGAESMGGAELIQSIVCASPSYRIDIQTQAEASGQNVTGTWTEQTREVTGALIGTVGDGKFDGSVKGPGFTATVELRSNGRVQSVKIVPTGADITEVTIDLRPKT
ncbi:MAG: hypothetical protein E7774_05955 [Bradyrhizobium sp.]|nr:MAG: hypothetical protein E7774_05955 [Bradyrhizobium sp.]